MMYKVKIGGWEWYFFLIVLFKLVFLFEILIKDSGINWERFDL